MPPTRSAGSRQPLQPQPAPPNVEREIIVLSSDDDEPAPPPRKPYSKKVAKPRLKANPRTAPAALPEDVVDISSEGDSPSKNTIRELQRQLAQAKRKIEQLEKAKTAAVSRVVEPPTVNAETHRLVSDAQASKKKLVSALEEHLCCEICTLKMWTPYTLSCGHSFCKDCLQDWFSTILAQHMTAHPDYSANPPIPNHYRDLLRHPRISAHQREMIQREIEIIRNSVQHPKYNCPSCRVTIKTKPAESFVLKSVVRTLAEAQGEASPKTKSRTLGKTRQSDPWDGFFPERPAPA